MLAQGDRFFRIRDGDAPRGSRTTALVASLITHGALFAEVQPFREYREIVHGAPVRRCIWLLKEQTRLQQDLAKMVRALPPHVALLRDALYAHRGEVAREADPESLAAAINEEFPDLDLVFIRAGIENFWKIMDALRRAGWLDTVRRGEKQAHIPHNAAEPYRGRLLQMLN